MKLRYDLINQKYIGEGSNTTIDTTTPEGMKQLANIVKDSKMVLGYVDDTFTLSVEMQIYNDGQIEDAISIIKSVDSKETLDPTCWVHIEAQDEQTLSLTCSEHFDDLNLVNIDIKYINGEQVINTPPDYGTIRGTYIRLNEDKKPQKYYITVLM